MADTTYNSLGVDEVAAQHVNAQCVVGSVSSDCPYMKRLATLRLLCAI